MKQAWLLKYALGALALASGCASLPAPRAQRALYIDARKALNSEARLGWTVDRIEVTEAAVQTEQSACRVEPGERAALRAWVDQRIAAAGGPAKQQWEAGKDVSDLGAVIDLERTRSLLEQLEQHVPADCPFHVRADPAFDGLHSVADRWVLIAESVGGGSLSFSRGDVVAGGGGAARVFAGYGLGAHLELALGVEAGGDAVLQKQVEESGTLTAEGAFRFGVPAFLRVIDVDRIYDLELAAISRLSDRQLKPLGARVALAGGVAGLRRVGFMPAIQLWVAYEIFPAQDGLAAEHVLRLGTRVGVDWHP